MSLDDLYKEVIMDHYKKPRNQGELPGAQISIDVDNPLCGDELTLAMKLEGDKVAEARFSGRGCSISMASASMMTEAVKGLSVEQAEEMVQRMRAIMHGDADDGQGLGDLVALQGVAKFPVRIKCALLAFEALQKGIRQDGKPLT